MGDLPVWQKLNASFFQSVTTRTAGFNSIDIASMNELSKVLTIGLMFIGAAPGSTGGGIKVTTIVVLLMTAVSVARGYDDTIITVSYTHLTAHRPLPWIRRAIEHPADPAVENCSCTHHAGFQRHIQIASIQPPIADAAAGRFNGQHLRVGQSTMSSLAQIMACLLYTSSSCGWIRAWPSAPAPMPLHACAWSFWSSPSPVSYTHIDVYKRQGF